VTDVTVSEIVRPAAKPAEIVAGVATPPTLSEASTVMVSVPGVLSVSVSVLRSALTCASVPTMVRSVVPAPVMVPPPLV
jgi:hypothetical protein